MSSAPQAPISTMLVEIDSILDTRLGVLMDIVPDQVPSILADSYHDRLWDVFPGVDLLTFQRRYKERDVSILKNSWSTPMADLMTDFVMKTLKQTLRTPFHKQPKIDINSYPYVLNDTDAEIIIAAVAAKTNQQCDVSMVSYSPSDLNPVFLKNHYEVVMMYDFQEWLEVHAVSGVWKKYTCPNVSVMAPLMVKNPDSYDKNMKIQNIFSDYETLSKTMAPYVDMQFLPLEAYCWKFNPDKLRTPTTREDSKDTESKE